MKKIFWILSIICVGVVGFSFAVSDISDDELNNIINEIEDELNSWDDGQESDLWEELDTAIDFLHEYEVTKYEDSETFMPTNAIRRDEAAKMYTYLIDNILEYKRIAMPGNPLCDFSDIDLAHSDLPVLIKQSCQYGLFKWSQWKFMPTKSITNAEAITVLMRLEAGLQNETDVDHFAQNYYKLASNIDWLLDWLNISDKTQWDAEANRSTIALLMYRYTSK